ncbi:MAG: hypothetical protein IK125_06835 [Lachnospiraceae bacterium]|nr:hypothetical protein [Lachnospiraceae bacterium]
MKKSLVTLLAAMTAVMTLGGCNVEKTADKSNARIIPVRLEASFFPDDRLRYYLYRYSDDNGDGVLDEEEILKTKTLNLVGVGVESLKGIEWLPELTYINCSGGEDEEEFASYYRSYGPNQLKEVDVSKNKKLVALYCNGLGLTSLDVSGNPELIILSCRDNELEELNVSENKKLEVLFCESNPLPSLNVEKNTKLVSLDVNEDTEVSGARGSVTLTRHDPNEAKMQKEDENIKHDDEVISDFNKAFQALLADEKYYVSADSVVTIKVDSEGVVTVSGIANKDAFISESYQAVYSSYEAKSEFRSMAYKEGGSTTFTYKWNNSLYTWEKDVSNHIEKSLYYEEY